MLATAVPQEGVKRVCFRQSVFVRPFGLPSQKFADTVMPI